MGGCMGVSCAAAFGVLEPETTLSLVLYWPVGGAKYRLSSHQRFAEHLAYVAQNGLQGVADLVAKDGKPFNADPRGGPWASVLKTDKAFRRGLRQAGRRELQAHRRSRMARTLFDRDTAPGAEPEDLMRLDIPALIVPGRDNFHATSAARYLEECLPKSEYWDVPVEKQTEDVTAARVIEFLGKVSA